MSNKTQIGLALVMVAAAMMAAATNLTAKREIIYLRDQLHWAELRISALESTVKVLENAVRCPVPGWGPSTNGIALPGGGWLVPSEAVIPPDTFYAVPELAKEVGE
jgi:hypothetical protein